jgi:hypothetical protein
MENVSFKDLGDGRITFRIFLGRYGVMLGGGWNMLGSRPIVAFGISSVEPFHWLWTFQYLEVTYFVLFLSCLSQHFI